mmetsp:Transcript_2114/g.3024  ORF Transcript_2114/g.3024 Transcript_2114/m.3024 type:complete len:150 (+) Transcript_2114:442-891(+)
MGVLGDVGGQAISILAIVAFLLQHYQTFAYYRDALKSHYYEKKRATDGSDDRFEADWHEEVRAKFESREPFEQDYPSRIWYGALSTLCCCYRKRWESEEHGWAWYKREKQLTEKINIATDKFDSEVDLKNIITSLRIGKFLAKLQTNKR